MADYIFLVHDDADVSDHTWEPYILHLQERGVFQGGSTVGDGLCARKDGAARPVTEHLTGYIRITADGMDQVRSLLIGNPQFEAGGTVEIRELPRSD
jgi:hypothetical protein